MKAVAFDIDDLLIDTKARKEAYLSDLILSDDVDLVKRRYIKGWYSHLDTAIPYAKVVVQYFVQEGYEIFFVTGRRASALGTSIKVMNDLGFPLTMDNTYFKPSDAIDTPSHKREAFKDIRERGYDLLYFFDDKISNLKVAKVMNIPHRYIDVMEFAIETAEAVQ